MLYKPLASQQPFFLSGKEDEHGCAIQRILSNIVRCLEYGYRPYGVVAGTVVDGISFGIGSTDPYVVVMRGINNNFIFQLRIGSFYHTDNIVCRESINGSTLDRQFCLLCFITQEIRSGIVRVIHPKMGYTVSRFVTHIQRDFGSAQITLYDFPTDLG